MSLLLVAGLMSGGPAAAQVGEQGAPGGSADPLQPPGPAPAEKFAPAESLAQALELGTAAVREAEQGGPKARAKVREAKFYAQQALKFDPASYKAGFILGRVNILIGQPRLAFSQINDYVTKSAEGSVDWEAYKILGDLHFAGTYYTQAGAKYRKARELAPNEPKVYIGLSRCALKQAQRLKAVQFAQKAANLDPNSAETLEVLSEALFENGVLPQAKEVIMQARDLSRVELRKDPGAMQVLSRLQVEHQSLQKILRAQLQRDQSDGMLYVEMTESMLESTELNRLGVLHQLQSSLQMGIEATKPTTPPELITKYTELSAVLHKHKEAIEVLEQYLETNPLDQAAKSSLESLKAALEAQSSVASAPTPAPAP